jgi:quercetin dioxygenase-like cupin family protein
LKPFLGKELEAFFEADFPGSPYAHVLSIRLMTLNQNTVIPFHVHQRREKLYIFNGPGILEVGMFREKELHVIPIMTGAKLVIPPCTAHFVKYFPDEPTACSTLVVSSSQEAGDILWENGVDTLIQNRR